MENSNRLLTEFLKPGIQISWGVSKSSFSNPSWNILMRALYRANLIGESGVINEILISQLSSISVQDVMDLKHVGKDRLQALIEELSEIQIPAYEPGPEGSGFEEETHYSIEQWIVLNILKKVKWRDEFLAAYGFEFDESIFEDELVGRKIRILELRMKGLTLDEIGKEFEVTRERVRQILKKAFKLVEDDPALEGKGFTEIFAEKTHSARGQARRLDEERKALIDSRVRVILNSKPGTTYLEIAQELKTSVEEVRESIHPQTSKFIWTEAPKNVNSSQYSDEAILEALKFAEAFESPISAPMYRHLVERGLVNGPGPQTVAIRFGSWKRACELAEVTHNESVRRTYEKQWTRSEMLESVIQFLLNETYGKGIQSYDAWRIETMSNAPSGAHVRKYFDTWIDTKNLALMHMRENQLDCNL